ncbi:MBL fold metallo-hydrolase, partial [Chloroflexota bacterium]
MADVIEVGENIHLIDNRLYSIPELGATYLINEEKKALVETGPTSSAGFILDGLKEAGVKPGDIDYIIVTHIHLDHAGGAGFLLKYMPQAKVVVHHRGARHLADPARLVKSMREAQGEEKFAK